MKLKFDLSKVLFAANAFCIGVMIVLAVTLFQWEAEKRRLMSEQPWLSYPMQPFPLPRKEYHPGEQVTFPVARINADTREHVYSTSHRLVCDGRPEVMLPGTPPVSIDVGLSTSTSAINAIPADTPIGSQCYFRGVAEINGQMLSWTVGWRTERFRVVAP